MIWYISLLKTTSLFNHKNSIINLEILRNEL